MKNAACGQIAVCTIISYTTGWTKRGPERVTCRGRGTVEPGGVDGREVEALSTGPLCGGQAAEQRVENQRWHRAEG